MRRAGTVMIMLMGLAVGVAIQVPPAIHSQENCPGAPPSQLTVGSRARVSFGGTSTRLRTGPSTGAEIVLNMRQGTEFSVIGGPRCGNEYTWWQVRLDDGTTGWSAEGDLDGYFIEPLPSGFNLPTATPGPTASDASQDGLIAYIGEDDHIWLVQPDGSLARQLPLGVASAEHYGASCPQFSPDGTKIAFPRYQRGTSIFDLVVVDLVTGELRVATVLYYKGFDWSPDSTRLVYSLEAEWPPDPDAMHGLWVVDLMDNSENAERELIPPQGGHALLLPDWSPDGERIAFHEVVGIEGLGPLGVVNADGSGYTVWDTAVGQFDWSPDGTQITYDKVTYVGFSGIYLANADGSAQRVLVDFNELPSAGPQWSPDGELIAFTGGDVLASIWVIEPDGENRREVPFTFNAEVGDWSPDGTRLVTQAIEGPSLMQVVGLDGRAPVALPQGRCPSWGQMVG